MSLIKKLQGFFQKGEKLDVSTRFEILREAITGTMSHFHMARDHQTGKVVGLKLLDTEKTIQFEARFKGLKKPSEGEISMQLKHPRIVESLEYGVTKSGQQYLVMEFCHGTNLSTLILNQDPVLEGRRVNMIRQMAEALDHVHRAGYIHRDVCPRNFIYNPEDDSIKLIDFGLTVPATKEFMQPGNRTGTPVYMAPEVVRRRPTDQRLDIYAFGVTIYQLLTFTFPWPVTDTTGRGAMSHDAHPPKDIREYRSDLTPALAAAVMKCVEPLPEKRFDSMSTFLRAIREVKSETT
ncbi:MAG: serine/threonine-protein kinase [Pirellulales bacterium]